ncbi:hypothetical protein HYQ46_000366 [Verticillium longisporum]|nr:hypothetical protein HYQ46_000366 [Verticillium longisporum]
MMGRRAPPSSRNANHHDAVDRVTRPMKYTQLKGTLQRRHARRHGAVERTNTVKRNRQRKKTPQRRLATTAVEPQSLHATARPP